MATLTSTDPPRRTPPHIWLAARARNAVKRPVFIGAVSIATFAAALVALVLTPQQARRLSREPVALLGERPDTEPLIAARAQAVARRAAADSALKGARRMAAPAPPPVADTLSPQTVARRDSLSQDVADLSALLMRAENAPLSASYRALA